MTPTGQAIVGILVELFSFLGVRRAQSGNDEPIFGGIAIALSVAGSVRAAVSDPQVLSVADTGGNTTIYYATFVGGDAQSGVPVVARARRGERMGASPRQDMIDLVLLFTVDGIVGGLVGA